MIYQKYTVMNNTQEYPLITIVTPTYNRGKFIVETVESVLSQSYPNIEYIVVDDGSTDNTACILEAYKDRIILVQQANIGQVKTLNNVWKHCRGKYIGYLSSDDLLYPNAIDELVRQIEKDNSFVCVFPDSELIDVHSKVIKRNICRQFDLSETLVTQECYIGPGAIFRKDAFELVGGWREDLRLAPDREFWIRLSSLGRIEMNQKVLAKYRIHPDSGVVKETSESVGQEYLRVLDDFYSSNNIPAHLFRRKNEAYGYAYLLMARNCFRSNNFRRGKELYSIACQLHPAFRSYKFKLRLIRNVISRPIRILISNLKALFATRRVS